jgi:hypothetical protein
MVTGRVIWGVRFDHRPCRASKLISIVRIPTYFDGLNKCKLWISQDVRDLRGLAHAAENGGRDRRSRVKKHEAVER